MAGTAISQRPAWPLQLLLGILIFSVGFGAIAWRVDQSPDIFTDEIIYTRLTVRVSGEGALAWDSGEPFLVHPPLYFLIGGLHQTLFGDPDTPVYAAGDIFDTVANARYLNAVLAGLTAVAFYLLGLRLHGTGLGVVMAALFVLDPFAVRINRRAMLETLAALLAFTSLLILFYTPPGSGISRRRILLIGLFAGLAMLTKELAFPFLLVFLAYGAWESRRQDAWQPLIESGVMTLVAILTYGLYPLWALTTGYGEVFIAEKWLGIRRLLGLVQLTGWNRPEISLTDLLLTRLGDYGTTYFLLALGGVGGIVVIILARHHRPGRLLVAWWAVFYPFFAFLALFGSGNDQFFYFLLFPAIALASYGIYLLPYRRVPWTTPGMHRELQAAAVTILLLFTIPFNLWNWVEQYGIGEDNGYYKMTSYVQQTLPPGTALNASGDPIKYRYFLPDYPVLAAATPQEAQAAGLRYFFLAPKDVRSGYGRIRPELADWIRQNGTLLRAESGDSYGDIFLYRVQAKGFSSDTPTSLPPGGSAGISFAPARAGFIIPFVALFALYLALFGGALAWLTFSATTPSDQSPAPDRAKSAPEGWR